LPGAQRSLESVEVDWRSYPISRGSVTYLDQIKTRHKLEKLIPKGQDKISIFMLQTRFDRSKFDGLGGISDDLEIMSRMSSAPDFFKSHPVELRSEAELLLHRMGAKNIGSDLKFYDILSTSADLVELVSVSSGSIIEADYFGVKSATMLKGQPWIVKGLERFALDTVSEDYIPHIGIDKRVFNTYFWESVLENSGTAIAGEAGLGDQYLKKFWKAGWG